MNGEYLVSDEAGNEILPEAFDRQIQEMLSNFWWIRLEILYLNRNGLMITEEIPDLLLQVNNRRWGG